MHFIKQQLFFDNNKIQKIFLNSLLLADLTIQDIYNHNYQPFGCSAIAILKSSHAAIHTWPEHGYISIDIFICDEFSKGLKVIQFLKNQFNPQKFEFFYSERGKDFNLKYEPIVLGA